MKINLSCRPGRVANNTVFFVTLTVLLSATIFLSAQQITATFRFEPDLAGIRNTLATAPPETETAMPTAAPRIELPDPDGVIQTFRARETRMLAPKLAAQYPDFRTYTLTDPETGVYRGQLFVSRFGLHGLIFAEAGTYIVEPLDRANPVLHEAYREDIEAVECLGEIAGDALKNQDNAEVMPPNGTLRRTYRLAIAITGEYYQQHGNTDPLVTARIVSNVSDLTALYKRELSVEFTLLTPLLYPNPATDPFVPDGSNGVPLYLQSAAVIGANFNVADYDIGHTINYGGGGVAYLGVVCWNGALTDPDGPGGMYTTGGYTKAAGWSGSGNVGLSFLTHFGHEVGHMFGASHTFNGSGNNCNASNISAESAYEIGSGSTIMSYWNSCGAGQNLPGATRSDYFHSKSLEQMIGHLNGLGGSCPVTAASGNQLPAVTANPCGGALIIPKSTPFTLTGSGSDPDGHPVFFTWEQIDDDGAGTPTQGYTGTTAGNSAIAPLFRSYPPTLSPARHFPDLSFVANNANAADFEALPNVARTINFRLQARDGQPFGAINNSDVAVTVNGAAGPLAVTAPNTNETWAEGSSHTVTWSVNGTAALCANVYILLSLDGGYNFPYVLAANTPNDGSHDVTLPTPLPASAMARIKVECRVSDCLSFFDVSNVNFTVTATCLAQTNKIFPTTPRSFLQGHPDLDLSFIVTKSAPSGSKLFDVTAADPLMNRVRWNGDFTACITPGSTTRYEVFRFIVNTTGFYSFTFGTGNFRGVHLFQQAFDPNGGCTNFLTSSVQDGVGYYSGIPTGADLNAGTEYFLIGTNEAFSGSTTVTFGGPGALNEVLTFSGDYGYTYVAVNTFNNQIAQVDAGADFTSLLPGSYRVYGVTYKAGGATPPPLVNPANFVGQTIPDIINAGACVYFSDNYLPLTVTAPPSALVINEVDYDQPGTDDAEFIELKNVTGAPVDLSAWTLDLVDGNAGGASVYQTIALPNVMLAAGAYFVVCGDNTKVPNCNHVVAPATDLIQDGAPDAIGLRENGTLKDAVSYEGNTGAPYTEGLGVAPGDDGAATVRGISRGGNSIDTHNNSADFISNACITPGAANVTTAMTLAAGVTNVACFGGANGSIALSVSGATPPFTYAWNNSQTAATAINLTIGTYTATVTDTRGCAASTSATVSQPAVLALSRTFTNVLCFGGQTGAIDLSVSGGTSPYTYDWSNDGPETPDNDPQDLNGVVAGTYTVTVTDANGCTATISASVTQPAALALSRSITNLLCNSVPTGAINLSVSGGTGLYTFDWSNDGAENPDNDPEDLAGVSAGTYTVTVTDTNGCTATNSATVTQPTALSLSGTFTNSTCGAANGSINLTVSGATPTYTYDWSNDGPETPDNDPQDPAGLLSGTYTVTVTDANGCTATASATLGNTGAPVTLGVSTTNVLCNGATTGAITLTVNTGTAPFTYDWSNVAGTSNPQNQSNLAAGTYTVTVTGTGSCTATISATLTQPPAFSLSSSTTGSTCGAANGSINLTVSGATPTYTYDWSNDGPETPDNDPEDLAGLVTGTYTVTVSDANGCTATTAATVNNTGAAVTLGVSATNILCNGASTGALDLTVNSGTSPYMYDWSNDGPENPDNDPQDLNGLPAGAYTVTVTATGGCTTTISATLTQPVSALALSRTITGVLCNGASTGAIDLSATGGTSPYTYDWSNDGPETPDNDSQDLNGLFAGTYTVTVTDANGCTATNSATLTQPAAFNLSASTANSTCANANGAINLSVSGATPSYTYDWSTDGPEAPDNDPEDLAGLLAGTYTVTVSDANGCTATASASVGNTGAPVTLVVAATNVPCFGGQTGALDLTVNTGTAPFAYDWSNLPGANDPQDQTSLAAGTYTVTVTGAGGCMATASAMLTQPAALNLSVSTTNATCNNPTGAVNLIVSGGTGPYTYDWSTDGPETPDNDPEDLGGLAAGTYTVTVTDANGCTATTTAAVTNTGAPVTLGTAVTNVLCNSGSSGAIDLTVNSGTAPFTYDWSNLPGASNPQDQLNLAAGTYTVTVTGTGGCTATISATLTQPPALNLSVSTTNATCNNPTGAVNLIVSGGTGPYTYDWSTDGPETPDNDPEDLAGLLAGTYTVTVSDANGCTATASASVGNTGAPVTLGVAATNVPCFGGQTGALDLSETTGTAPFTYDWSNLPGANDPQDQTSLAAGTYTVTVTGAGGCTATASATLTQPPALNLSVSTTNATCNNPTGAVNLTVSGGTGPYTYDWSTDGPETPDNDPEDLGGLAAGTYTVTVTDANGCTATTTAAVTNTGAPVTLGTAVTNVLCNSGSSGAIDLTVNSGTAPFTYDWSNLAGASNPQDQLNLAAGTYTVTVTGTGGCTATISATLTQPPALNLSVSTTNATCNNPTGAVNLIVSGGTGPYTYDWSTDGPETPDNDPEDLGGLAAGTYTVTVTDANGCSATTDTAVNNTGSAVTLGTATTNTPCNGAPSGAIDLTVTGNTAPYTYDWSNDGAETPDNDPEDLGGLPAGTYTVTVTDANGCTGTTSAQVATGAGADLLARAAVRVFLQGPYVSAAQLMHDSLRVQNRIPLTEPYTSLTGFTHVGGGGEQTTPAVLAVSGSNAVVDWVFLELRSDANPAQVLATRSALVQRDGDVVDVDGASPVTFNLPANEVYFITVRHRNHLGVQIGQPVFYPTCGVLATDFRSLPAEGFYAFNGLSPAQKIISGTYTLWAGNGRIDFQLKYNGSNNDRNAVLSVVGLATPNAIVPGYKVEDYNLDGVVKYNGSANDRNVLLGNVGIATPSAVVEEQVAR